MLNQTMMLRYKLLEKLLEEKKVLSSMEASALVELKTDLQMIPSVPIEKVRNQAVDEMLECKTDDIIINNKKDAR